MISLNKNKVKLWVDVLMFLDFLAVATSGAILKFVYPAGERSARAGAIFLFDRFEWLGLHDIFATILLCLIIIHLILNWNWIKAMIKGIFKKESN